MPLQVAALYSYPIKSCARLEHQQIALDDRGPVYDRRWMVVSEAPGEENQFMTARELPRLAVVQPRFAGDELALTAPDMPEIRLPLAQARSADRTVVVWNDTVRAMDEGDVLAGWFSDFLGYPLRLVRLSDDADRPVSPQYARAAAQVGFADGYPLLLAQTESLDDLNQRMAARGKAALPMSRFRPNIVVSGSGQPWAEDTWRHISAGDIPFDVVKPCARCVMTTVDPATGTIPDRQEPLATLATFRKAAKGVMFGQNIIHRALGTLHVGDAVEILETAPAFEVIP
jgi:uncharacterized protein YcbX